MPTHEPNLKEIIMFDRRQTADRLADRVQNEVQSLWRAQLIEDHAKRPHRTLPKKDATK